MSRTPESVLHETDYWQLALNDLRELNHLILDASQPLPGVSVELLNLILSNDPTAAAERAGDHLRSSLDSLSAMDEPVCRLIRLVEGRLVALRGELEDDDET